MKQATPQSPITKIINKLGLSHNRPGGVNSAMNVAPAPMGGGVTSYGNVARLTKYSGLILLAIVVLSVIILNIISSYSNSSTRSNAEPVGNPFVLANDSTCDPNNTNAQSCISMSISSHSATGDTNDGNLSLSIPQGGGLVAGRHTVSVKSNNINGYQLMVEATSGIEGGTHNLQGVNLEFVHNDGSVDKEHTIPSLTQNNDKNVNYGNTMPIENNTWGIAVPDSSLYGSSYDDVSVYESYITNPRRIATAETAPKFAGMYTYDPYSPSTRGVIIDNNYTLDETSTATPADGSSLAVYYGVRVDHPNELLAGNYQAEVVYTATVNLPPTPTNLSVSPTTYEFDSCNDSLITIEGTNLSSVYEVYLQKSGTTDEVNRLECTNLDVESNAKLTCNIPTSRDEVELNTTYDIYVISQAASPGILQNAFTYTEPATGLSVKSDNENINGNGGGHWESLTKSEIESNTDTWFNYTNKQWANAVTVTKDSLSKYQDKHTAIDNNDVLGYWVYIPRYAYEVMRPNAVDRVVNDTLAKEEGGFNIHFETADDTKKIPAPTCNTDNVWVNGTPVSSAGPTNANILAKDYRTGCWPNNRTYHRQTIAEAGSATDNTTTWATHPAFTWGDTELNGLWVGKFETTGKVNAPTVKPNQHANISEYIGEFSTMAKSIGKEDKCNVGGNAVSGITQNSHNLQTTKSHMLKNSEWGAVAYLSASKYGAGVNGTQINSAYPTNGKDADGDPSGASQARYGITGCGPDNASGSTTSYNDGTALSADLVESPAACSQNTTKAYNGSIGVLASTTNTVYGIYDMSGGAYEYVMGNLTGYDNQSETSSSTYMATQAKPPYVDLYKESQGFDYSSSGDTNPAWSKSTSANYYNNDVCTWETCGGHALHETKQYQSISSNVQSWGSASSYFVYSSGRWFRRGGSAGSGSNAGLFNSIDYDGNYNSSSGFRSALLALPAGQ